MAQYGTKAQHELASIRDTVQSIWVAIVLAFVLRAFVVEAFVIPTGSMAPRLYGEHLDLVCRACGHEFAFGWSVDKERGAREEANRTRRLPANGERKPKGATCPTCGYDQQKDAYVAGGDRVLVMKYLYRFQPPKPWDVIVFKNPQDNQQNYIKRLIGLPGETIEIVHGDVFVRQPGTDEFSIRRKDDHRVQDAMWQVVFDNDFRPNRDLIEIANRRRTLSDKIVPPQWRPRDPNDGRWKLVDNAESQYGRVFRFTGAGDKGGPAWLELDVDDGRFLPRYGYDVGAEADGKTDIVSDLKLEGAWQPAGPDSRLALSIGSFEYVFTAHISGDGSVRLVCGPTEGAGSDDPRPLAPDVKVAPLADGRGHVVSIRHVDLRVSVWIDGQCVAESSEEGPAPAADRPMKYPMDYKWLKDRLKLARKPVNAKPIPQPLVRIAADGSDSVLQHVKLMRDVYYTSPRINRGNAEGPVLDFSERLGVQMGSRGWGTEGHPITLETFDDPDLNQYFVMGDNSPSSLDGRLWIAASPTLRLYDDSGLRGDPNLAIGDVDWPSFLRALLRRTDNPDSSPGAYIWSRLSPDVRGQIKNLTPSELRDEYGDESFDLLKRKIVGELNRMIAAPGLYAPKAWLRWGVMLPDAAGALVQRQEADKKLSPKDLARLNRLAIQAAMPEAISPQWRTYKLGTVPQYSLIGKAIFVYWPSGFRVPGLSGLPIIPNVGRMRLIR